MRITAALMIGLLSCPVWSQPPPFQPQPRLSLALLVVAETDRGQPDQLLLTLDTFRVQRRTIEELDSRIRLDTADEKTLLLKYPRARSTKVRPDAITAFAPAGRKQISVAADEFRFFDLRGRRLTPAAAIGLLQQPRAIFLFDDSDGEPPQVGEVFRRALRPDCLIAISKKRIRETQTEKLPDSVPRPQPPLPSE
jgi:hypothetical protein